MPSGPRFSSASTLVSSSSPPLEAGDHLTRDEFERRFDATPGLKKAELVEGIVYVWPSVRFEGHAIPHANLVTWLGTYQAATPGVRGGDSGHVRLDFDNELQPDATLLIDPALGGQSSISADNYLEGAPELVAEISGGTASIDLHGKLRVYQRNGVREYLVQRVYDGAIDWFALRQGQYEPLPLHPDGTLRSEVFPGLWLDAAAMIKGDLASALRVLQQGLQSPEHAAFVAKLQLST
jgi:Uma2 family endonuclease